MRQLPTKDAPGRAGAWLYPWPWDMSVQPTKVPTKATVRISEVTVVNSSLEAVDSAETCAVNDSPASAAQATKQPGITRAMTAAQLLSALGEDRKGTADDDADANSPPAKAIRGKTESPGSALFAFFKLFVGVDKAMEQAMGNLNLDLTGRSNHSAAEMRAIRMIQQHFRLREAVFSCFGPSLFSMHSGAKASYGKVCFAWQRAPLPEIRRVATVVAPSRAVAPSRREQISFSPSLSPRHFITVSETVSVGLLATFMSKYWHLARPEVLITVTGGAQDFSLTPSQLNSFETGLNSAAKSTNAWIISAGSGARGRRAPPFGMAGKELAPLQPCCTCLERRRRSNEDRGQGAAHVQVILAAHRHLLVGSDERA